jgi:hypothetical protein
MFIRRGRLSARKARAVLDELFDHHYQWLLRSPIIQLLQRGDPLRFLCTMRFLIDWMGDGIFLVNQRQPPNQIPWFGDDMETTLAGLAHVPKDLTERLTAIMRLDAPVVAEMDARRLLLEIIELAPREKKRGQQTEETSFVSWLSRIAALEPTAESPCSVLTDQADMRRIARRAVRIVWRLPGSRLAALTGSVAAGYADVTSDIDISLFGLKLPEANVRRSLIAATSSAPDDITQLTAETQAADAFWLAGASASQHLHLVDVRYFLIGEAQQLIEHPVPLSRSDEELLAALSTADILVDYESRGPDLLNDLRKATQRARPQRLAKAVTELEQALAKLAGSTNSSEMFYATTDAILALFQLLAARNDRWIVFPKRTVAWLSGLEHIPHDLHERLSPFALLPFRSENLSIKLETLRTLASETGSL